MSEPDQVEKAADQPVRLSVLLNDMDYETFHYEVVILPLKSQGTMNGRDQLYGVQNKHTGVVEFTDRALPNALGAMINLERMLVKVQSDIAEGEPETDEDRESDEGVVGFLQ